MMFEFSGTFEVELSKEDVIEVLTGKNVFPISLVLSGETIESCLSTSLVLSGGSEESGLYDTWLKNKTPAPVKAVHDGRYKLALQKKEL